MRLRCKISCCYAVEPYSSLQKGIVSYESVILSFINTDQEQDSVLTKKAWIIDIILHRPVDDYYLNHFSNPRW